MGDTVANATYATPVHTTGSGNTLTINVQVGAAITGAPADSNDAGLVSFDDTAFGVDANGYVTLLASGNGIMTNTGDDAVAVSPDAMGNFNWIGLTVANATHAKPVFFKDSATANAIDLDVQVGAAITGAPADSNDAGLVSFDDTVFGVDANGYVTLTAGNDDLHDTRFIVSAGGAADGANYTTIASAITDAVTAGGVQDIFVQPGTYNESITWPANINLVAHSNDGTVPTVTINGNQTLSYTGTSSASGIYFTNSGAARVLTCAGSQATVFNAFNCFINTAATLPAISLSNSNNSTEINLYNCQGDTIANSSYFNKSGNSSLNFYNCNYLNSGNSITGSSHSGGNLRIISSTLRGFIQGIAGTIFASGSNFLPANSPAMSQLNTVVTTIVNCYISSSSNASFTTTSSGASTLSNVTINSTNSAPISGTGSVSYGNVTFTNSGDVITSTTHNPLVSTTDAIQVTTPGAYPYTCTPQDGVVLVDSAGGARTINLNASPVVGQLYHIKDASGNSATNNITITPAAGNIDGSATYVMNVDYMSRMVVYNGSEWSII